MCGICGQYNFKDQTPVIPQTIETMTRSLIHRGPDDEGFYISGPVGLGFRRLSIIDLAGGHQPMSDFEKSVWVIFNGEIYNFPCLKRELEGFGHVFRTRSDTEVIVHGYKQWGEKVFNHLNGMFGVAIWDVRRKKLLLARDATGIKSIYYKLDANQLFFGSEIRPLLALERIRPDVDAVALNLFLRYRYTPSPLTVFQGIKKLAPGSCLIVESGTARVERWWNFMPVPFSPMPTVEESEEELLAIYLRAVKRHLISDVPVGLLLSGGLDSSLLLALMNHYGNGWKTYTVGYGESFKDDELSDAAQTATLLDASNTPVRIDQNTFEETLSEIISALEEPIASSSIVPMYHVCKRAREDVKVALIGQGPDELFGGYTRHLGVRYGHYWRILPQGARSILSSFLSKVSSKEYVRRGVYSLGISERIKRYQQIFSLVPGDGFDDLFRDGVLPNGAEDQILKCWDDLIPLMTHTDEMGGFQFLEIRSSLPDELLMYADKLSMQHGLELRVPYLDREIVEYVERLPASFKVNMFSRKWLHRRICRKFLPPAVVNRKKRGFAVNVVDEWFKASMSSKMNSILLDESSMIYKYLNPSSIIKLLQDHRNGSQDNHKLLFSLVVLEKFLRQ